MHLFLMLQASSDISPVLSLSLLKSPNEFIPPLEAALSESIRLRHDPEKHDIEGKDYRVGFRGSFGDHHLNPRTLRSSHLGNMISVEGIVTRCMSITMYAFKD
jgi:DNA replication licensing factor MCM3